MSREMVVRAFVVVGALALTMVAACNNARRTPSATCSPTCSASQMCCTASGGTSSACINHLIDPRNCGACNTQCLVGQSCINGSCSGIPAGDTGPRPDGSVPGVDASMPSMCSPTCAAGFMCCGTNCIDADGIPTGDGRADSSFDNCGTCGLSCNETSASRCGRPRGATMGRPVCLCGDFTACSAPRQCLSSAGEFRCIDPSGDDTACGAGAVDCTLNNETCSSGVCTCAPAGRSCGAELCGDTGCIDITTDVNNCGAVGRVCNDGETCAGGECRCGSGPGCIAGGGGGFPGGGSCSQLCCAGTCVENDADHCGTCATACSGTEVCGTELDFMTFMSGPPMCGDPEGGSGFFMECMPAMGGADGGTGTPCIVPGFPPGCV